MLSDSLAKELQQGALLGRDYCKVRLVIKAKGRERSVSVHVITHFRVNGYVLYLLAIYETKQNTRRFLPR